MSNSATDFGFGSAGASPVGDTTKALVTDLCGRREPFTVDLIDAADSLELTRDDLDHIFDMWADGNVAYIGEIEYRPVA